ncbi:phage minor capsid protein [Streptomyces sparsogenes]|uniref:phage minor capsid protein n=1 Tax=Streptomyces sparsogenes TaxID=67365 RepID=UPI003F4D68E6
MEQATSDPAGYEAGQRQWAIERGIRKWKNREAAAVTPEALRAARAKVRQWQGAMRDHRDAHPDLRRLRHREQPGASNLPAPRTEPTEQQLDAARVWSGVQAAELPASNGIGTARALARMYAALIGEVDGVRLLSPGALASATEEQASGMDQVMLIPSRFSTGYMLLTESNPIIGPSSFGHTGRGGSLAFADPGHGVAFAYTMNRAMGGADDRRAILLVDAVRRSVL